MKPDEYLGLMKSRLSAAFDFKSPPEIAGFSPALWAEHRRISEKYFLSKKISLYSIKNDEYAGILFISERLEKDKAEEIAERFRKLLDLLKVDEEHMSSIFTVAIVCEKGFSEDAKTFICNFKARKNYLFTLKGWSDLGLILLDLETGASYSNKIAEKIRKFYEIKNEKDL